MTSKTTSTTNNHNKSIILKAILAGSISSSFYLLQLCIHFLSSTTFLSDSSISSLPITLCASLNKIFGPMQPFSRSLTLSWLVMSWFSLSREEGKEEDVTTTNNDDNNDDDKKKEKSDGNDTKISSGKIDDSCKTKQTITRRKISFLASSLLCLCLMYMPEGLKILGIDPVLLAPAVKNGDNNSPFIKLEYTVDNMDCGGCVVEVEGLLTGQTGVISAKVTTFALGEVEIYVNTEWVQDYETVTFEKVLNETLIPHGFELHERGWKTKMMTFDEHFPSN